MERNQWLYSHHRWLLRGIGTQTTLAGISTLENTVLGPATITSVMLREDCKLNCHVRKAAMAQEIEGCCQLCGRNHLGKSLTLCALVSVSVKWLWWVPALPAVTGVLPFPTIIHRGIQYMLENLPRADECEASLSFWSSLGLGTFFLSVDITFHKLRKHHGEPHYFLQGDLFQIFTEWDTFLQGFML